ncbi:MAG: rRNA pseudouridine synthase [Candidatus Accumulibacter sp.]|jgi:23S rRNA pseudouridine2604 synthase|nr:rRNA pseudouridine synthase [Accumulibacter sp.]
MPDTRRKTLGLPARVEGEQRQVNPRRKPIRGEWSGGRRKPAEANAAPPVSVDKIDQTDWRKKNQAKRDERHAAPPDRLKRRSEPSAGTRAVDSQNTAHGESGAAPENSPKGVRVSKLMAERGLCSRREADEFIVRGWVYVDGERVAELGTRADPAVKISLDAQARAAQQRLITILLHKPVGYVSGQPEPGCQPASVLIRPENQRRSADTPIFHASHLKGLAPAGRLDVDSTGLLVLTQDGRVAKQLIGENSKVDKEYLVRVEGQLTDNGLALLNHGLSLDGKPLKPARVEWLNDDQLRFVLNEGRKRQIRRMCELVGLRVTGLKRVRIGALRLGDLPSGQWRCLRENETF